MEPEQGVWASVAKHFQTSTALNPTIVICAICTPLALILAAVSSAAFAIDFLYLAAVPVIIAAVQIIILTVFAPDRLHDNRHVEKKWAFQAKIGLNLQGKRVEHRISSKAPLLDNPSSLKELDG